MCRGPIEDGGESSSMSSKALKDLKNACSPFVALPQTYSHRRPYCTVGLEVLTVSVHILYTEAIYCTQKPYSRTIWLQHAALRTSVFTCYGG